MRCFGSGPEPRVDGRRGRSSSEPYVVGGHATDMSRSGLELAKQPSRVDRRG